MVTRLRNHLGISKENWNPKNSKKIVVNHYSIPNFDRGVAQKENTLSIKSNKFLITRPCVLISKLNPDTPRIWLIEEPLPGTSVCSTEFVVLIPKRDEDLRYVYFLLKSSSVMTKLKETATGTSNSHQRVRPEAILELEVQWIEDERQRVQLADFLWMLERKIQLNTTLSKTLEEIARALFKSWFVDFDPVKAKMAGEKPVGMDSVTAALFPDFMEDSELGLIPKGWEVTTFKTLTKTLAGGTPSRVRDDFWNGTIPWFNSGKVNDFRIIEPSEYITQLGLEKSAAKLLPIGTTVLAITGATLGQYSRLEIEASGTQNVIGILESDKISNEFIYSNIISGIKRLVAAGTGGAQQHINKEIIDNFKIIYTNSGLISKFTELVKPSFLQIGILMSENKSLAKIRDSLLPRLISGELQIPEDMLAS